MNSLNIKQSQSVQGGVGRTITSLALVTDANGNRVPEEARAMPKPEGSKGQNNKGSTGSGTSSSKLFVPVGGF